MDLLQESKLFTYHHLNDIFDINHKHMRLIGFSETEGYPLVFSYVEGEAGHHEVKRIFINKELAEGRNIDLTYSQEEVDNIDKKLSSLSCKPVSKAVEIDKDAIETLLRIHEALTNFIKRNITEKDSCDDICGVLIFFLGFFIIFGSLLSIPIKNSIDLQSSIGILSGLLLFFLGGRFLHGKTMLTDVKMLNLFNLKMKRYTRKKHESPITEYGSFYHLFVTGQKLGLDDENISVRDAKICRDKLEENIRLLSTQIGE